MFYKINEKKGRYFAIFIFVPILILISFRETNINNSNLLLILAILLLIYELIWVIKKKNNTIII